MVLEQLDRNRCKKMKLDPYIKPYIKSNSKWIKDLIARANIIKPLEETLTNSHDFRFGKGLLDVTPKGKNW